MPVIYLGHLPGSNTKMVARVIYHSSSTPQKNGHSCYTIKVHVQL